MQRYTQPLTTLPLFHQGKTRDTYDLGKLTIGGEDLECLLVVATDRISTHNIVHEGYIPMKGYVLSALTVHWLAEALHAQGWAHHMLVYGAAMYDHLPGLRSEYPEDLHFRAIIVRKLTMIPREFIMRAYLTGSLYELTRAGKDPYGLGLSKDLQKMIPFVPAVFTPTEKSEHDEPLDHKAVIDEYPAAYGLVSQTFEFARDHLLQKGVDTVDSKFEIGIDEAGFHYLADEVLTPDSSRFIAAGTARVGEEPEWLDKQIARDEAIRIWSGGERRPIKFSPLATNRIHDRYMESFKMIQGTRLREFQQNYLA